MEAQSTGQIVSHPRIDYVRTRRLGPPRAVTGTERRRVDPNRGLIKLIERRVDMLVSGYLYPRLGHIWNPYSRLLERRFGLAQASLSPADWPSGADPLRILLISDIHTGIFLDPGTLSHVLGTLSGLRPDLVAIAGDIVTGHSEEILPYLEALAPLARAPLGAWFGFGNHDYFDGDPGEITRALGSVGIRTLRNEAVALAHGHGRIVLGGIDDMVMGSPDWDRMVADHGVPHLLLAHNPDHFYEAERRGVALTLSGHTHGGQIRLRGRAPLIRQSRFCLDEGLYAFRQSMLVVSRGLGAVGLPWRWGADPEAVVIDVTP